MKLEFGHALMSTEETEEMALLRRVQPLFRNEYCIEWLKEKIPDENLRFWWLRKFDESILAAQAKRYDLDTERMLWVSIAELLRIMLHARYANDFQLIYIDHDAQHFEMVLTRFQHNPDFFRFLLDEIAPFSDKYTQHILILQKVLESYGALDRVGVFEL